MRNILIADDHEVTRRGVGEILREAFADADIVGVGNAGAVLTQLITRSWDLVILDIIMPGSNILELLASIRATHPSLPVLVLTAAMEVEYAVQTIKAGANGLIHKHRAAEELLEAIRKVADGGMYLHAETALMLAAALRESPPTLPHHKLSERELEIFLLIARGRAIKAIAGDLGLSDKTIATYLVRIREKTGLISYVDIARYALQNRLVD
jgi:two-component system, NarL family, invasion response regulator UvrY